MLTNSEIMSAGVPPKIEFFFEGSKPNLRQRRKLRSFISLIFSMEKRKFETINFIFATDRIIHGINKKYLFHDFFTDVITFELSKHPILAEIYISCDRVSDNAKTHKTSFGKELHRVIFHGVLHLCGYSDKGPRQQKRMRTREDYYLSLYFG